MKKRTTTCRAHCAVCGLHFGSNAAFEDHRVGSFDDPDDPRRCEHPIDFPPDRNGGAKFMAITDEGECRVYEHRDGWGVERGVTIWSVRAAVEAARRMGLSERTPKPLAASEAA